MYILKFWILGTATTTTTRRTTARTTTTTKRTTTTRTTTARTTTTTKRTTERTTTAITAVPARTTTTTKQTTVRPILKTPEELLGLPEIPTQPVVTPSPIFQIRVESPKSFQTSELDNISNEEFSRDGGRWQIIPPVEASKAIARHRVDPEQPILSLAPPPPPVKRPVSPFQIVGHVMSDEELKSFPDSPIGKSLTLWPDWSAFPSVYG